MRPAVAHLLRVSASDGVVNVAVSFGQHLSALAPQGVRATITD